MSGRNEIRVPVTVQRTTPGGVYRESVVLIVDGPELARIFERYLSDHRAGELGRERGTRGCPVGHKGEEGEPGGE